MLLSELEGQLPKVQFREAILKAAEFKILKKYSRNVLQKSNIGIDFLVDQLSNDLVVGFKGILYGSKIKTEEEILIPDGRIANLKLAVFNKWLLKKFPPKMKKITKTVTVYNSYPSVPVLDEVIRYQHAS